MCYTSMCRDKADHFNIWLYSDWILLKFTQMTPLFRGCLLGGCPVVGWDVLLNHPESSRCLEIDWSVSPPGGRTLFNFGGMYKFPFRLGRESYRSFGKMSRSQLVKDSFVTARNEWSVGDSCFGLIPYPTQPVPIWNPVAIKFPGLIPC